MYKVKQSIELMLLRVKMVFDINDKRELLLKQDKLKKYEFAKVLSNNIVREYYLRSMGVMDCDGHIDKESYKMLYGICKCTV